MPTPRRLAFLLEDFSLAGPSTAMGQPTPNPIRSTPAQQLVDRLLLGYPYQGEFRSPRHQVVSVFAILGVGESELRTRTQRGMRIFSTAEDAVRAADDVLIVPRGVGAVATEDLTRIALNEAPNGARIFVYGALANTLATATEFYQQAELRDQTLIAGSTLSTPWLLPPIDAPQGVGMKEALIVVQGAWPYAELFGVEGILPVLERRRGREAGIQSLRSLEGPALWHAGKNGEWSARLLASALSRSHTPQGDAIKDGRTQDLIGLGLVPKLAVSPRAWQWTHVDGLRTTLLILDGVVADFNFALELQDRSIFSAQIFRAPPPAEHHYGPLAFALEDFFASGRRPWSRTRETNTVILLEWMRSAAGRSGRWLTLTPFPQEGAANK